VYIGWCFFWLRYLWLGEMESVESGFLEKKGMIRLGLEILGEEKALLFFGALLVIWYSWHLFSSAN